MMMVIIMVLIPIHMTMISLMMKLKKNRYHMSPNKLAKRRPFRTQI